MVRLSQTLRRSAWAVALFLAGSVVFAAAYGQAALYYSNQNQYFLHGMAEAGFGFLNEDWLANTRDPTPIFSAVVSLTQRYLHPAAFYFYYALVLGAYAAAMLGLFGAVVGTETAARRWPIFVALLILVHSALVRWSCQRWLGLDYPWYLQTGLAGQYILGPVFQPSVFGVLLVVAIYLFVGGHPYLAVVCAALAGTMHFTYLLLAGLVVAGFLTALLAEGRVGRAAATGAVALILVIPAILHVLDAFRPTSAEVFAEAEDVLIKIRIPHHARPERWWDVVALGQVAWFVVGLLLTRGRRLFLTLSVPALLGLFLTLAQVMTGSRTLALLFPWRISVVLVPIATTAILARLTAALPAVMDRTAMRSAAVVLVVVLMTGGMWISLGRLGFQTNDDELAMLDFVRRTRKPGDVYFLPVRFPPPTATKGAPSSDFKPLAAKQRDARIISVDLQRFRLYTGVPIFVDFKAIPYKDTDVLEWKRRMDQAQEVMQQISAGKVAEALAELRRLGINHLVVPVTQDLKNPGLVEAYEDRFYRVYRKAEVGE